MVEELLVYINWSIDSLGSLEAFLFIIIVLFALGMIGWLYRTLKRTMNHKEALLQEFREAMKKKGQES